MVMVNKLLRQHYGGRPLPLSVAKLKAQMNAMLRTLQLPGGQWDAGLLLTTDKHIQSLNRKHRNKDKPTDILSFPNYKVKVQGQLPHMCVESGRYLGDMFISLPYVEAFCVENGAMNVHEFDLTGVWCAETTLEERMPILVAHGLVHLMGYDHETDEDFAVMSEVEDALLENYVRHLPPHYRKERPRDSIDTE
ncbi:hypothetical protein LEN26_013370 [Aphanomyces euteiches]|nr:hypothetical protein LEN26_013370 [Aphanomyces euteiches]KAH9112292.1 hypothetical protein AeMF1_013369 [Aphanomyces euteiches]KAH9195537.1 hypothetical protein AeNC1_002497 [Aphanomyces euteiches]